MAIFGIVTDRASGERLDWGTAAGDNRLLLITGLSGHHRSRLGHRQYSRPDFETPFRDTQPFEIHLTGRIIPADGGADHCPTPRVAHSAPSYVPHAAEETEEVMSD